MGIIVTSGGRDLWEPSSRVGWLFFSQIKELETLVGQKSGIEISVADTLEIDAPLFASFVTSLLDFLDKTNNAPLFALCQGCTEIAIALNASITRQWPVPTDRLRMLILDAKAILGAQQSE